MSRLRERNDYFEWRGDRYAFHQLVDGPVLARLDPDSDDEQTWTLHSRRVISPTGAEVRDIAKQVHGVDLPEMHAGETIVRVRDDGLAARVSALEARVAALEAAPAKSANDDEFHIPETAPIEYADEAEPEPFAEPYVPDFTIIPEALSRYAEADETAEDFRLRLKSYFQRFGIDEGKNFPGGGEPLSGDEKIQMREIDIMLNSDTGKAARLHDWLFAD
ncbi:hypothetical protein UFOVP1333_49 [uncultured Caudovirales phage]|uniref:Uncharacterized protein n=1 Tax=uncultured Caudovirales phage TaxID=2100421 RepID=A0A6J5RQE2_9CAUD|nr:hypothetical protein UFOVP1333_49 [uncultured Caudovirales phage]